MIVRRRGEKSVGGARLGEVTIRMNPMSLLRRLRLILGCLGLWLLIAILEMSNMEVSSISGEL
jgi:hypothetical protein